MQVKICGLTRREDLDQVNALGADFAGFILYPSSRRYVSSKQVHALLEGYQGSALPVAVFVDAPLEEIQAVTNRTGIRHVQLHGNEPPALVDALRERGLFVIKALHIQDAASLQAMDLYRPDRFLLDTWHQSLAGGTGQTFEWQLLESIKARVPEVILAGGLNAGTIRNLFDHFEPWGIDLSSGVEKEPGIKDKNKLDELFQMIREHYAK